MTYATLAARYASTSIATAPREKLLVMLFDRLVLDLRRAENALRDGDTVKGRENLAHAQDIIAELISTLNVELWDDGPRLLGLYTFVLTETISASNNADADKVVSIIELVTPLADAFKQAAEVVLAAGSGHNTDGGFDGVG